jgi:DNA-directed RNA polymerase subunit omega
MNKPTVDEILQGLRQSLPEGEEQPNRYTAAMVTAKRARQINTYYRSLGEGGAFEDLGAPLLPTGTRNYLSIAMEEVARGEVTYRIRS